MVVGILSSMSEFRKEYGVLIGEPASVADLRRDVGLSAQD